MFLLMVSAVSISFIPKAYFHRYVLYTYDSEMPPLIAKQMTALLYLKCLLFYPNETQVRITLNEREKYNVTECSIVS
jgi:hypothetical protein